MRLMSFDPVVAPGARVLILGSMPGVESLRQGQYYAHPRNRFWDVMGELCGAVRTLPYPQRLAQVMAAGIALWDVLQYCERAGSLDSNIVPASEVPNDLRGFLAAYPTIRTVCFNGQKAAAAFRRHVAPTLDAAQHDTLRLVTLPSTSPAHAALSKHEKSARWRAVLQTCLMDGS